MTMSATSEIAIASDLMQSACKVIVEFPDLSSAPATTMPPLRTTEGAENMMLGTRVEDFLANPAIVDWLVQTVESWPKQYLPIFLQCSRLLAFILQGFGVRADSGLEGTFALATKDQQTFELMMALAQVDREAKDIGSSNPSDEKLDPLGFKSAVMQELLRRRIAHGAPFATTLTTLLGQDALLWLTAESHDGPGKIQPHEFSRSGWHKIWEIETQIEIEKELILIPNEYQDIAKAIVATSWTLVALANLVRPEIFLGEYTSHLVSIREGGRYTVTSGPSSHTLVSFQRTSMLIMLDILHKGLNTPLMSAVDLMWIAASLVKVEDIKSGLTPPGMIEPEVFQTFLSHRGRDAKLALSEAVNSLHATHGMFLDCLTLPHGTVNRYFVFSSLARSRHVVIVETVNFSESDWCRKEAWFADAMRSADLVNVERMTLEQVLEHIGSAGPLSKRHRGSSNLTYPITQRILKDIDYWARSPNLYSLKKSVHSVETLLALKTLLEGTVDADDPTRIHSLGEAVRNLFSRIATQIPKEGQIDLWASALQLGLAAFAITSNARSKDGVRRGVDNLNATIGGFIKLNLHFDKNFQNRSSDYLALITAASFLALTDGKVDPRIAHAINSVLCGVALLRDGILLLDVRPRGPLRNFHLQLIALLIKNNIGTVAIIQNFDDEVHSGTVDDLPLELLPCVTLYPGMSLQL